MLPAGAGQVVRHGRLGPGRAAPRRHRRRPDPRGRGGEASGDRHRAGRPGTPAGGAGRAGRRADVDRMRPRRTPTPPARRQLLFGLDAEQLRLTLKTMATDGREPTWSMGDDTPLAVMARRPRPVGRLPPPGLCPGHEPADRPRARAGGHEPGGAGRAPAAAARPGRTGGPPLRAPRGTRCWGPRAGTPCWPSVAAGPSDTRPWQIVVLDATWPAPTRGESRTGWPTARRNRRPGGRARSPRDRGDAGPRSRGGAPRRERPPRRPRPGAHPEPARRRARSTRRSSMPASATPATCSPTPATPSTSTPSRCSSPPAPTPSIPWHAIAIARDLAGSRGHEELDPERAEANLLEALEHGLRKVLARMGISTLASYRGGQLFDVIGLADAVVDRCFPAAPRTVGAASLDRLGAEALARHATAYPAPLATAPARRGARRCPPRPRTRPRPRPSSTRASPASAPTASCTPSPRRSSGRRRPSPPATRPASAPAPRWPRRSRRTRSRTSWWPTARPSPAMSRRWSATCWSCAGPARCRSSRSSRPRRSSAASSRRR